MNNKTIFYFAIALVILLGWFYISTQTPESGVAEEDATDLSPKLQSLGGNISSSANAGSVYIQPDQFSSSSLKSQQESIGSSSQRFDSVTDPLPDSSSNKSSLYQGYSVSQASSQRSINQGMILHQGSVQPSKTLEEKQRDWWFQYSRQVPQLMSKGDCAGVDTHPDIEKLKRMADGGDKCAMGNYANAVLYRLGREYAPQDEKKMNSLRIQIKPLFEYLELSTGTHPLVAGVRSCAVMTYFGDIEDAIAWQMIEVAYYSRDVPYLMSNCNSFLTPPDNEEAYQRALALAHLYIDY